MVHMLGQHDLARTRFPVGHIDKTEVRRLAVEMGLRTATKPDSQDVCFITHTDGRETFLGERIPLRPADVVDRSGMRLGRVEAVEMVTVGQRRGIGLPGGGPKRYVVDVDPAARVVTVGSDDDLLRSRLIAEQVTWVDDVDRPEPDEALGVLVQCSAHGAARPATVSAVGDGAHEVRWAEHQRRVAPGQSVVFYDESDRRVLGGGICR